MNKIVLNNDEQAKNYIRFLPANSKVASEFKFPTDEADQIDFCEKLYINLTSNARAKQHFLSRQVKHGIQIAVIEFEQYFYLTLCFQLEEDIYQTTIYINDNLADTMALAKFQRENLLKVKKEYKQMCKLKRQTEFKQKQNVLNAGSRMDHIDGQA